MRPGFSGFVNLSRPGNHARIDKFPVLFPDSSEFRRGDGFDRDCIRHHALVRIIRAIYKRANQDRALLDIDSLLRDAVSPLRNELQNHRIAVEMRLAPLSQIRAHKGQLQQVILNLIINAIEAMVSIENRPRLLTITSAVNGQDAVLITVEDSGIGVSPEKAKRIFDPFFTTKMGGTGMGLAICLTIIEHHGGHLWLSADHTQGCAFHISLPRDHASNTVD